MNEETNVDNTNSTIEKETYYHTCYYCGQKAHYQLKNGRWCCKPHHNSCPARRKQAANKRNPDGTPIRDYKKWRASLPKETQDKMNSAFNQPEVHEKAAETLKQRYDNGELTPFFKNKKHKPETIEKIRASIYASIKQGNFKGGAKISRRGCAFIDSLNEKNGWHLQHGLNGGEIVVDHFYLDGYDEELNIAFEYDERSHYADVKHNILKACDIKRMQYIHKKLNCRFFRYNETTKQLYEVIFEN